MLFLVLFICVWFILIGTTILIILIDPDSSDNFIFLFSADWVFAICLIFCTPITLTVLIISKINCRKRIKKRKHLYDTEKIRDIYWDDFRDKIKDRMNDKDFDDKIKDRMG